MFSNCCSATINKILSSNSLSVNWDFSSTISRIRFSKLSTTLNFRILFFGLAISSTSLFGSFLTTLNFRILFFGFVVAFFCALYDGPASFTASV